MKKNLIGALALVLALCGTSLSAQELDKKVQTDKYIRNSVCLMMMEDASVPQKAILEDAFLNAQWNNKYNNHNTAVRVINPAEWHPDTQSALDFNMACVDNDTWLTLKESNTAAPKQPFYNETMTQILRSVMASQTTTIDTVIQLNVARTATKYLNANKVAHKLVDQWFMDNAGNYTDSVVVERGMLNVSGSQQQVADASAAGAQKLMREIDVNDLVSNTFVVVTRFSYKEKDALVADRMLPLYAAAQFDSSGYGQMGLKVAEMAVKASLGAGYYVTVDSYLFRLRWNDAIAEQFYGLWDAEGNFNTEAYAAMDFQMQFIGNERAWARTKAGIFSDKSEEELIRLAAVDAVDAVLAKFERKYDQFKTKTPLLVTEVADKKGRMIPAYGVNLGSRDGLEGGEVFEVLEKKVTEKDGLKKVSYEKKGELTVDKKQVWDNSYSSEVAGTESGGLKMTVLTGKDKQTYYEGMLLRMKTTKK